MREVNITPFRAFDSFLNDGIYLMKEPDIAISHRKVGTKIYDRKNVARNLLNGHLKHPARMKTPS